MFSNVSFSFIFVSKRDSGGMVIFKIRMFWNFLNWRRAIVNKWNVSVVVATYKPVRGRSWLMMSHKNESYLVSKREMLHAMKLKLVGYLASPAGPPLNEFDVVDFYHGDWNLILLVRFGVWANLELTGGLIYFRSVIRVSFLWLITSW